jgi:uncharacterized protein YbjT (DUF2867 family)
MTEAPITLVVGATGILGTEIVRQLMDSGVRVRAVVRDSSNPARRLVIERLGAHIVFADLKQPASLEVACRGVTSIISTATSTISRQDGDSIQSVDDEGQLSLVQTAEFSGVERFVFISFPQSSIDSALQKAKRNIEARLRTSRLLYTVLQPAYFTEVWFSPLLGFDPKRGKARILGNGEKAVSWISICDVARFAVRSLEGDAFMKKIVPLAGPDPLSPLQVVEIFERLGRQKMVLEYVPESVLEHQAANEVDPLAQSLAAIMLALARGQTMDPRLSLELLPGQLNSVRKYAQQTMMHE